jgi:hypothetical protein
VDLGAFEVQQPTISVTNVPPITFTSVDQTINLSATATVPGDTPLNEGQVQFTIDGIPSSVTANVMNGQTNILTFTVPGSTPHGSHIITATYTDDSPGNFRGATANGTLTINPAVATLTPPNVRSRSTPETRPFLSSPP